MEKNKEEILFDVLIVGGGWNGLYALKYMLQENLNVICLEKEKEIGGVWLYKETFGGVMKTTIITSSLTVTEASDFPLKIEHKTDFPDHWTIHNYLKEYATHFNLYPNIRCDSEVISAEKIEEIWHVKDISNNEYKTKRLIVVSGSNYQPKSTPQLKQLFSKFKGEIIHSAEYKYPKEEYERKNILIIGGGESASDIATELSYYSNIYFSIANGQWFGTRKGGLFNSIPLEHFSSRARRVLLDGASTPMKYFGLKAYTEFRNGFHGHGIDCWRCPYDAYATSFINKNTEVMERISLGTVHPKPNVLYVDEDEVRFVDGSKAKIDLIILCCGYSFAQFPWLKLPKQVNDLNNYGNNNGNGNGNGNNNGNGFCVSKCYKMCIYPEDPTLSFVGYARPLRGSIPTGGEMQSLFLSLIYSGKLKIPPIDQLRQIGLDEKLERDRFFKGANKRAVTLVEIYNYVDDIAKIIGVYPNYKQLYKELGLKTWLKIVVAPYHASQFLLNDPKKRHHALEAYDRILPRSPNMILIFSLFSYLIYLFICVYKSDKFIAILIIISYFYFTY